MSRTVCIVPVVEGIGGGASFRLKFEQGLRARGVTVHHDLSAPMDAVLLIGGTKDLPGLLSVRRRGVPVIQRLDGINWVHRKRRTGFKHFLRAEYGNRMLSFLRLRVATKILYQSHFSQTWWEGWFGRPDKPSTVIHNGVDLSIYSGQAEIPAAPPFRVLLVEGSLGGGYDMGLENAVALTTCLQDEHGLPVELVAAGQITDALRERVTRASRIPIRWMGAVPRAEIPALMRSAHVFFSADLHPACPNSVIEALACGLPVVSFDTGALRELVPGDAGRIVSYGADPWKIERPDIPALAKAAVEILADPQRFRRAARAQAESALGLEAMTDAYLNFLLG